MPERQLHFLLFPGVTLLDLVGPLTVLRSLPAPYRAVVVGEHLDAMETETTMKVVAEETVAQSRPPFAVIVPGGPGGLAAMTNEAIHQYLRRCAASADVVASVCTGSLILAAAGLLDGRRATTHWAYAGELERLGATYVRQRWVEDGKFITAAGISAGIDMALALAARFTDEATARRIQLSIEYDPQPPFGGIAWDHVGDAERTRQRQTGTGALLAANAAEIFASRPDLLRKLRG